jgi:hypothetical protein
MQRGHSNTGKQRTAASFAIENSTIDHGTQTVGLQQMIALAFHEWIVPVEMNWASAQAVQVEEARVTAQPTITTPAGPHQQGRWVQPCLI